MKFLNILLSIFAIFLTLLLCEAGARVFHLSNTYDSYPGLVSRGKLADYSPKLNSQGWKDREFSKDKDMHIFRIACVGDSVTEGYRLKQENTFPKILENRFKNNNYPVEVMNLGKCESATPENLAKSVIAIEFNSDLIIYQFGLNDTYGFEHSENTEKLNLKTLLRKSVLYLALKERYNYIKLKLGYRNWAFDKWDVRDWQWDKEASRLKEGFSEIKKHSQLLVIYMPYDFQVYSPREEVFIPGRRLAKLCKDNGYYFIDFTQVLKDGQKNRHTIYIDDCHLSDYSCKVVGNYLYDFILRNKIIKNIK